MTTQDTFISHLVELARPAPSGDSRVIVVFLCLFPWPGISTRCSPSR